MKKSEDTITKLAMELFSVEADQITPEMRRQDKIVHHARNYSTGQFYGKPNKYGEPWRVEDDEIFTVSGKVFYGELMRNRIVACINFCAGTPDEHLENSNFQYLKVIEDISSDYMINKLIQKEAEISLLKAKIEDLEDELLERI